MEQPNPQKQASPKVILPQKEWPARMRATLAILLITFAISATIIILKNDLVGKKIASIRNTTLDYIGYNGFALQDIIITGRKKTTIEEIKTALNLKQGDNLLKANVTEIKHNLENLPWIRDVEVKISFLPNILKIEIKEKEVFAIWQLNEKFYPLDMDGYVIEADYKPTKPILLIVGTGAAENIIPFIKTIAQISPDFVQRIKVANYISKRRWNIILDDIRTGITIKLPEENIEHALQKLLKLDNKKGILKRKLTIIDLRLDDKVTVKLRKTRVNKNKKEHEL